MNLLENATFRRRPRAFRCQPLAAKTRFSALAGADALGCRYAISQVLTSYQ